MKQANNKLIISEKAQEKVNIFNKYNDLIEEIKWLLFAWLRYEEKDGLLYYEAYFSVWESISYESIEEKVKQASEKIDKLMEIKQKLENEYILNWAQKKLIEKKITDVIDSLEYHKNAIYIEAEKAGFKLTDDEREEYNQKKLIIEQKLYWDPITKLEFRKNKVLNKLQELYDNFPNDNLSEEEKKFWKEKIEPILGDKIEEKELKNKTKIPDVYINEQAIFQLIELLLQIEWFKKDEYIKIEISKNKEQKEAEDASEKNNWIFSIPQSWKTKEIYDYFKSKWLWQKFKIIKKNLGNNSVSITKEIDNFKKNEISLSPSENGKYNLTKKVLPVIFDHETSTHVNTWIGNFFNLYLNDPERSDLEEGVAMVNERFSQWLWLDDVYETSQWDVRQFFWEIFDDDDLKNAISIYYKLSWNKGNVDDGVRRVRIGIPRWKKWSRRKDLIYGKAKENIKELEDLTKTSEWIEMLNKYAKVIYSTKLWNEAIKNIDEILDWITDVEKLEPNFPIFAGKIIYWKLFKGKLDKDEMLKNDLRRLIRTNKTVNYEQKRLLVQILQIIEQDCEYKKSIENKNKSE